MSASSPPAPRPRPIDRLSPSLGESLLACPLRTAFRRDPDFHDLERGSTFGALGLVSHALTEEVSKGRLVGLGPEEREVALAARFAELVDRQAESLRRARPWAPLPQPERWPGYTPTRRRLLRRLAAAPAGSDGDRSRERKAVELEEELRAPDLPLLGRPDRVEHDADGVHLVDLKTGWGEMGEMRPVHRRQLLIYAFIWYAVNGIWPVDARIERLDGSRLLLPVDPEEATTIVEDLLERRSSFNAALDDEIRSIASPSPNACANCDFRAACPPFFESVDEGWERPLRSLLGVVEALEPSCETLAVRLRLEAGDLAPGISDARIRGLPAAISLEVGETVAAIDLTVTRVAGELRPSWDSSIYSWSRAALVL